MTNKTTEALESAEEAFNYRCTPMSNYSVQTSIDKEQKALAAIREARAEQEKQEPVAWRVHPFDYGVGHEGAYAMTMRLEQVEAWNRKGWIVESLYATPVDAKAIRAEALEEAAEWCDRLANNGSLDAEDCAAAIRGLK